MALAQLKWNPILDKRDLLELVIALFRTHAIQRKDGAKLTFAELVRCFGSFLDVEIKKAYNERSAIYELKGEKTEFLTRLINTYK